MTQHLVKISKFNQKRYDIIANNLNYSNITHNIKSNLGKLLKLYCEDIPEHKADTLFFELLNKCDSDKTVNAHFKQHYVELERQNKKNEIINIYDDNAFQTIINSILNEIQKNNKENYNKVITLLNIENMLDEEIRTINEFKDLDVYKVLEYKLRKDIYFKKGQCPFADTSKIYTNKALCLSIDNDNKNSTNLSELILNLHYNGEICLYCPTKSCKCRGTYYNKNINIDNIIYLLNIENLTINNKIELNITGVHRINIILGNIVNNKYFENETTDFNELILYSLMNNDDNNNISFVSRFIRYYLIREFKYIFKKGWYKFDKHRWVCLNIDNFIFDTIGNYYNILQESIKNDISIPDENKKIILTLIQNVISNIILNENSRNTIIKNIHTSVCNDKIFEENLDKKPNLVSFTNGIYKLESNKFRNGKYDDMISIGLNYDYSPGYVDENFFESILPDKKIRRYFFKCIASFLYHEKNDKPIIVLTGNEDSKEQLIKLLKYTFCDYIGFISSDFLTDHENTTISDKRILICNQYNDNDIIKTKIINNKNYGLILTDDKIKIDKQDKNIILIIKLSDYNDEIDFHSMKHNFMYCLLEYFKKYDLRNIEVPENLINNSRNYHLNGDNNVYDQFLDECTEKSDKHISVVLLYETYKEWRILNNISGKLIDKKDFKLILEENKNIIVKPSINTEINKVQGVTKMCLNSKYQRIMENKGMNIYKTEKKIKIKM